MRRGYLLLLLVLCGRDQAWSPLAGWVGHDASEKIAWAMTNGRRLRLGYPSMRRQTANVDMRRRPSTSFELVTKPCNVFFVSL